MQDEFEMSMMGELKFFLGLQIVQSDEGIKIHQTKYTKELLKKYKMDDAKSMKTLMHPSKTLGLDEDSLDVDITMYWGMVGLLLYLTASRTEIMFSVCVCARFQVRPKEVYLQAVKRILRYLKGTTNLGISFYRSHNFSLLGYYDADYAWDKWERKSTSGGCHFLGHCLVSWSRIHKSKLRVLGQVHLLFKERQRLRSYNDEKRKNIPRPWSKSKIKGDKLCKGLHVPQIKQAKHLMQNQMH
uniref:Reverse transcriptase Ty1/copia-type domain-containing protein n=1 Tax=Cajanus cajan TaxID=3821 RepID=A0A151RW21_CAJCA|nr:hypothetical protein KK1_031634 [Cajanus cajan]